MKYQITALTKRMSKRISVLQSPRLLRSELGGSFVSISRYIIKTVCDT